LLNLTAATDWKNVSNETRQIVSQLLVSCQQKSACQDRAGRISIFEQAFGSGGTIENSPAFQCRDRLEKRRVPQGRLKKNAFSGVLAGLVTLPSNPGVQTPGYFSRRGGIPSGHSVFGCPKIEMLSDQTELICFASGVWTADGYAIFADEKNFRQH
jgi:hypothetical protein